MRELDYNAMHETSKNISELKQKRKIDELVCATCGYEDEKEGRYEMEVFS